LDIYVVIIIYFGYINLNMAIYMCVSFSSIKHILAIKNYHTNAMPAYNMFVYV